MKAEQLEATYSEQEAERRFDALVRVALNTPPKPMKHGARDKQPSNPDEKGEAKPCS